MLTELRLVKGTADVGSDTAEFWFIVESVKDREGAFLLAFKEKTKDLESDGASSIMINSITKI